MTSVFVRGRHELERKTLQRKELNMPISCSGYFRMEQKFLDATKIYLHSAHNKLAAIYNNRVKITPDQFLEKVDQISRSIRDL